MLAVAILQLLKNDMKKLSFAFFLIVCVFQTFGQSSLIPYNQDYYHLIDRFTFKYPEAARAFQTTYKPVSRTALASFLNAIKDDYSTFSVQDQYNFEFLMNDSWEYTDSPYIENDKSWWNTFYNKKSDFLGYSTGGFNVHINPVLEFSAGKGSETDQTLYTNTRGAEIRGSIDGKIGFYTFVTTTEARFPEYVRRYIRGPKRAFPNEGFWKDYGENGWDLLHARGYFTFGLTKSIQVQAGYDKNFIGDGLRSMILSDFSSPYLFLKLNTQVGPFQYTNLFAELTEDIHFSNLNPGDGDYPKKFWAFHRLGINITPRLNLGLFESVMSRSATLAYFNPIVFYRAIELQEGSPDNVILGLDFKLNMKGGVAIYGQGLFDEFVIDELRSGGGSWRNRFGVQLGAKYIDAFKIANLDLQAEMNLARPFLYQSEYNYSNYSNYRNPLAHPLGANFKELALVARYQPVQKLYLVGKLIYTDLGEDFGDGVNYGGHVMADTDNRVSATGNKIGQGANAKNALIEIRGSYMLLHNVFLDLSIVKRNFNSELADRDLNSTIVNGGLRWNLAKRQHEF